ncbi:hypothetical protein VTK26DRAFT_9441 [Humicola hyalothermophila]
MRKPGRRTQPAKRHPLPSKMENFLVSIAGSQRSTNYQENPLQNLPRPAVGPGCAFRAEACTTRPSYLHRHHQQQQQQQKHLRQPLTDYRSCPSPPTAPSWVRSPSESGGPRQRHTTTARAAAVSIRCSPCFRSSRVRPRRAAGEDGGGGWAYLGGSATARECKGVDGTLMGCKARGS